jgi:signal recognition particle subunit SEC65
MVMSHDESRPPTVRLLRRLATLVPQLKALKQALEELRVEVAQAQPKVNP